jgi:tRNA pseudouridine38-40 synthase
LYEGPHHLSNFCKRPNENTGFDRTILACSIEKNRDYTANFFPEDTYLFRVISAGFMRNQVRLMVGQLVSLGMGEITLEQFKESLDTPGASKPTYIAPASGLILENIDFI